jgi:hypothetical protein
LFDAATALETTLCTFGVVVTALLIAVLFDIVLATGIDACTIGCVAGAIRIIGCKITLFGTVVVGTVVTLASVAFLVVLQLEPDEVHVDLGATTAILGVKTAILGVMTTVFGVSVAVLQLDPEHDDLGATTALFGASTAVFGEPSTEIVGLKPSILFDEFVVNIAIIIPSFTYIVIDKVWLLKLNKCY